MLTVEQASNLLARLKIVAAGQERIADLVMPNGKRAAECTDEYLRATIEAVRRIALDQTPDDKFGHT